MRKIIGFAALALSLAVFTGSTFAQPEQKGGRKGGFQGGGKGGFGGGMMMGGGMGTGGSMFMLTNKSVQDELKLSDEQKEKLQEIAKEQREKMRENFEGMREKMAELKDLSPEERQAKIAGMMKEATAPVEKKVNEVLKPEQTTRLKQITLQQSGIFGAVQDEEYSKELSISEEQKKKFKELSEERMTDMRELGGRGRGFDSETMKKIQALSKEYNEKAMKILSDEQSGKWKKLIGEPFEMKMEMPRRKDD